MLILHLTIIGIFIYIQAVYCPFKNSIVRSVDLFYYIFIVESYLLIKPDSNIFVYLYISLLSAATIVITFTLLYHFWYVIKYSQCVENLKIKFVRRYKDYEVIRNFAADAEDEMNAYSRWDYS